MNYKSVDIDETKKRVLNNALWQCEHPDCHLPAIHVAHSIAKTVTNGIKANRRMVQRLWYEMFNQELNRQEIDAIIHWPEGLHAVCGKPECNDHFNIGNNPEKVREYLLQYHSFANT